jgi:hypothetical protein
VQHFLYDLVPRRTVCMNLLVYFSSIGMVVWTTIWIVRCRHFRWSEFLGCCYVVVTLLLRCCYVAVTLLLRCCYVVVTLMLRCF